MPTTDQARPRSNLRALVALNAALLMILAAVTFGGSAGAQRRVPGEYTMAAGGANGTESSAVYIIDVANQEMMAVTYDHQTGTLQGIGFTDLAVDAASKLR
jgi:hypothetical protein